MILGRWFDQEAVIGIYGSLGSFCLYYIFRCQRSREHSLGQGVFRLFVSKQ